MEPLQHGILLRRPEVIEGPPVPHDWRPAKHVKKDGELPPDAGRPRRDSAGDDPFQVLAPVRIESRNSGRDPLADEE